MKIIDRYVLKEHLGPLLFALSALTSLLLLNYIAKQFGKLVGKGLPWTVIGEFFLLSLPFTVAMTVPMAVLVATLYAFSRMASENEITAFKASGVSIGRLMSPVIRASVVLALLMIVFNDQLLPWSNYRLSQLQTAVVRKKPTLSLKEQVTNRMSDRLWLRAARINGEQMREVVIYDFTDPGQPRTIYADSGTLAMTTDGRDLALDLFDGNIQEFPTSAPGVAASASDDGGAPILQQTFFVHARRLVRDVGNQLDLSGGSGPLPKSERERTVCELQDGYAQSASDYHSAYADMERFAAAAQAEGQELEVPERQTTYTKYGLGALYCRAVGLLHVKEAAAAEVPPGGVAAQDSAIVRDGVIVQGSAVAQDSAATQDSAPARVTLPPNAGIPPSMGGPQGLFETASMRASGNLLALRSYDVEIHKKFALATACIVFVLLGAPIALRFPRGGVGVVIGVSLGVFALYYVGLIAGETAAEAGYLPPAVAMWSANIVFTLLGLVLLARAGREASTARGGDMAELLENGRAWLARLGRKVGLRTERRRRAA